MGSSYAVAIDIIDLVTWNKGNTIYKNNIMICRKKDDNEIKAIFQVLDVNHVKLLYTADNLIDLCKIEDDTFKDSLISAETAKRINQCEDSIIFYRTSIYNEEGKLRYILRWKNGKISRMIDTYTLKLIVDEDSINKIFQNMKEEYQQKEIKP